MAQSLLLLVLLMLQPYRGGLIYVDRLESSLVRT